MAYQQVATTASWPASAQFVALGETSVRIVNPYIYGETIYWVTTADDTPPSISGEVGSRIDRNDSEDLILEDGERLWLVAPNSTDQTVFVTLLY